MSAQPVIDICTSARVIVTCGTGGVGKTSVAAALGFEAAQQGKRAIVITIDPARRLADAIGLGEGTGNEIQRVPLMQLVNYGSPCLMCRRLSIR